MGIAGAAPIADRARLVLVEYLNAEVDQVDTAANALAGSITEASFTTPTIPTACIQAHDDDAQAGDIRVVVWIARPPQEGTLKTMAQNEGGGTGLPRIETRTLIGVDYIVAKKTSAWGDDGAIRRCDRVATAGRTLLDGRYPQLSVPSLSLGVLQGTSCRLQSDEWVAPKDDDAKEFVARRRQVFRVHRIEVR